MSRGYNWRNTLTDFASVSGVLAGFCVAFIGLILGWSIADIKIYQQLTFGNVAVLFFGIATSLFITASEYFLHSKNFDVFDLSEEYRNWVQRGLPDKNWDEIWKESSKMMRTNESYGRWCYNIAIFIMFIGLFFAISPYNLVVASIVSIFGILLELWQFRKEIFAMRKKIILASVLLFLTFLMVRLFDMFYNSVLTPYNVNWKISITTQTQIDFYGAVVPTAISLFFIFYLVYFRKFSIKYYLLNFILPIAFALSVSRVTPTAIVSLYKVLALLVSFLVVFVAFYDRGLVKFLMLRDFRALNFSKGNYVNALLIAYSYASLSTLIVDLIFLPFTISAYIGAMGLMDGIMLSGLFTPLSMTLATLLFMFLYEMRKPTETSVNGVP